MTAEIVDIDLHTARVLPHASPALTQWILTAIEGLQQQAAEDWAANGEKDMWMAIGGVQALLGVLDLVTTEGGAQERGSGLVDAASAQG